MNGILLTNQVKSCRIRHTPQIAEKTFFFFQLPYLESYFMVAYLVRLNLAVLKISEKSQKHTRDGVLS